MDTLLQARKVSTSTAYGHVWQDFQDWMVRKQGNPWYPSVSLVLEFLKAGLDKSFSWSMLKGQVSAISAIAGIRWALQQDLARLIRAAGEIRPHRRSFCPHYYCAAILNVTGFNRRCCPLSQGLCLSVGRIPEN